MRTNYTNDRCTQNDYRMLFASAAEELRWLCYTLTGDDGLSEMAMDAALEQSLKGANRVFREWMLSWARRLIIRFCVGAVRPMKSGIDQCLCSLHRSEPDSAFVEQLELALSQPAEMLQQKLLRLDPLPRFVFVLRALEGYSRHDTALLLDIDDRSCEWAYATAVKTICPNVYVMRSAGDGMELVTA